MSTKKSFSNETSERYARALFEISYESKELDKVEEDVKKFIDLLNTSSEINNFIKDPTINIEEQNKFIILLAENLQFLKNLKNFLLLLIEKRRVFFVKKIFENFLRLCSKNRGEVKVNLFSSKELSQKELEKISNDLSKTMGQTLKLNYEIDKELIGGLKLQLGSFMIDTTIKNKLKKYEQAMLES
tara:strand:+ start:2087 stop:2644 length:558 start_codon:yes stop_codon:yes gene_type:complete